MTTYSLYPKITFLTCFTRTNGPLIDNFFCKLNKFVLDSTAGIFTKVFSDHQPYLLFIDINLKTNLSPKFVRLNLQNKVAMHSVKSEINSEEIYNKLNKCHKADHRIH